MILRVKKVLHHEKSKFQDVLIFESTDHGRVMVLDNVIQSTERDEFSYQEMITHLAMNSHPNPKRVLVIGGGDGGVLREVVKHDCVEEAILCDIDEVRFPPSPCPLPPSRTLLADATHQAVIRLSKEFLPGMSVGFDHEKTKVHIGDGFKFLDTYKNHFDVIITDSSDPEGPAESLFQKPYFQLMHDALREGGVITTQGCTSPYVGSHRSAAPEARAPRYALVRGAGARPDTGVPEDASPFVSRFGRSRLSLFIQFSACLLFRRSVSALLGSTTSPLTTCPLACFPLFGG